MPGPLDVVVPIRIKRIEKSQVAPSDISEADAHSAGFTAGQEAGRLRAEWEANRERQKEREKVEALVRKLESLHQEFESLISEHVPDLIHGALARVYKSHPFTVEEISTELNALLRDMEQAGRIALECAPAQADELRAQLEEQGSLPEEAKWSLQGNPALKPGEFILKSDLGDVDGRHSSRLRQIHLALEGNS